MGRGSLQKGSHIPASSPLSLRGKEIVDALNSRGGEKEKYPIADWFYSLSFSKTIKKVF